jgi:hypothetical protein
MFELWNLAEDDLLSESISYRLRDTGQGMSLTTTSESIFTLSRSKPSSACPEDVS